MRVFLSFHCGKNKLDRAIAIIERDLEHLQGVPKPIPTHCYLVFTEEPCRMVYAIEAVPWKVRGWFYDYDPRPWDRLYELKMTEREISDMWNYSRYQIGEPYNYIGYTIALLYLLTRHHIFMKHRSLFCSELCVEALRKAGIEVCPGIESDTITPALLEQWAMKNAEAKYA